jgi:two-component system, OmpR family, alkaline phosphatase synthesis response regulator PhoP
MENQQTIKILIVEDNLEIAKLIENALIRENFSTHHCADGLTAWQILQQQPFDVIVLDIMLSGMDGLELCYRIHQASQCKIPRVLMLSAKGEKRDREIGLAMGADDYLTKPFSLKELVARVRSLLEGREQSLVYRTQHFIVNLDLHLVSCYLDSGDERALDLTGLEFKLLTALIGQPQRIWSRQQLIERLWGNEFFGDERVVDKHINRLRQKLEPDPTNPRYIQTIVRETACGRDKVSSSVVNLCYQFTDRCIGEM